MDMHTDATHADSAAPVALSEDSATGREQLRILVVDDDETDRLAVRRYVHQSRGIITIDEASCGAETLEHVAATIYACIFLDYYLPGEDGLALLKAIHERTPTTPVVIFTGRGDEEIAVELMKAGATDYVPKASLTPARIASSLRHALAIAHEAAERRRAEEERERLLASEHAARQEAEASHGRLAMQYDVGALLASAAPDELPPVLPVICQGTALRWDWGALWQVDMEAGVLRCIDVYKAPRTTLSAFEAVSREVRFKLGEGLAGQVWQRGEAIWIADTSRQPGFVYAAAARKAGLHSGVVVPLRGGDQVVGVLSVFRRAYHDPDPEALSTLMAVGRQIGQFLERRRVETERILLLERERRARAEAERHAERTAALQSLTAALAQALSPEEIAAVVTEQGIAALGAVAAAVFVLDADAGVVETIHDIGYPEDTRSAFSRLPLSAQMPLTGALRSGEPAFYETPQAIRDAYPFLAEHVSAERYGSHALVPLILDGKMLGGLRFSFSGARTFDAQDRALVVALAQQWAQALERARLFASEQAARAEAEAAVRARDEFVAMVTHDLRNPLTPLVAQLQMLQRSAAQGKVPTAQQLAARLERMEASASRLSAQIDELQDATHLQAGRHLDLHLHPTDLVALAREAVQRYRYGSPMHVLQFETTVPSLSGHWDAERLERVIANLLSNATKYSPSASVITVRVSQDGDAAILSVEDHGMGIPADDLPQVFERYQRAGNATRQRIPGTGLGLAGARDIVEQHGGSIEVQSQEGVGCTFTVRLPCASR